jgi:hypothetical protein
MSIDDAAQVLRDLGVAHLAQHVVAARRTAAKKPN